MNLARDVRKTDSRILISRLCEQDEFKKKGWLINTTTTVRNEQPGQNINISSLFLMRGPVLHACLLIFAGNHRRRNEKAKDDTYYTLVSAVPRHSFILRLETMKKKVGNSIELRAKFPSAICQENEVKCLLPSLSTEQKHYIYIMLTSRLIQSSMIQFTSSSSMVRGERLISLTCRLLLVLHEIHVCMYSMCIEHHRHIVVKISCLMYSNALDYLLLTYSKLFSIPP